MNWVRRLFVRRHMILLGSAIYLLLIYFIYHSLHGERGIFSYLRLSQELEEKREILGGLKSTRTSMEQKVTLVRSSSLNLDMLDELARKNLGLIGKDEFVIIMEESSPPPQ